MAERISKITAICARERRHRLGHRCAVAGDELHPTADASLVARHRELTGRRWTISGQGVEEAADRVDGLIAGAGRSRHAIEGAEDHARAAIRSQSQASTTHFGRMVRDRARAHGRWRHGMHQASGPNLSLRRGLVHVMSHPYGPADDRATRPSTVPRARVVPLTPPNIMPFTNERLVRAPIRASPREPGAPNQHLRNERARRSWSDQRPPGYSRLLRPSLERLGVDHHRPLLPAPGRHPCRRRHGHGRLVAAARSASPWASRSRSDHHPAPTDPS